MKDIKRLLVCFVFVLAFSCQYEDRFVLTPSFVRFSMLVDNNGVLLNYPAVRPGLVDVNTYTHRSTQSIKIPIQLSGAARKDALEVFYEVSSEGSFTHFNVQPQQSITLLPGQFVDSLTIHFTERWVEADVNIIKLKITHTSDPELRIGWPNSFNKMDELSIVLGDLTVNRYRFLQNFIELRDDNPNPIFSVRYDQPVTMDEVQAFEWLDSQFQMISLCDGMGATFDYTISLIPWNGAQNVVNYQLNISSLPSQESLLRIKLLDNLPGFMLFGNSEINVHRTYSVNRQGDVASNWYNVSDALHRTFGRAWYFDNAQGICRWSSFSSFTVPVAVPTNSPMNNGQGWHRFRIGFIGPNPPIGTNPFDFRRFYENASVTSPAFNMPQVIDFFPSGGNSSTQGEVKILPQTLIFQRTNGTQVRVPICGGGTYHWDAPTQRWIMYLEIRCDETQINGQNNVVRQMYIYSNNLNNTTPPNLSVPCSNRISL